MKRDYRRNIFPSVWKRVEDAAIKQLIVSPRAVLRELESYEDDLPDWAKEHISFRDIDAKQEQIVKYIMSNYSKLIDYDKPTEDADPFVIALAKNENRTLITGEKYMRLSGPQSKPKIPNVCEDLKVRCISLLEFFEEQNWEF